MTGQSGRTKAAQTAGEPLGNQEALALLALHHDVQAQAMLLRQVAQDPLAAVGALLALARVVDALATRAMTGERWSAWLAGELHGGPRTLSDSDVGQHQALVLLQMTAGQASALACRLEARQMLLVPPVWRAACARLVAFATTHRAGLSPTAWTALLRTQIYLVAAAAPQPAADQYHSYEKEN